MIFVGILIAAGALVVAGIGSTPVHADDWFDCKYGVQEGLLPDEGIEGCTRILKGGFQNEKNTAIAFGYRCGHYVNKEEYDKAIRDCDTALEFDRTSGFAYNWRGIAYHRTKQYDAAFSDYDNAIRYSPNDGVPYSNRAGILYMRGNKEQALIDYNKSVALAPKDGRMWRSRASFYIDEQQYDKARQDLEKAASLGEKDARMAFTRGRLYFATGDYRAALSQFDDAVGSPQARNAYYYRSRTYAALKDISSALSDADMFVQNQPDEIVAYSWRGRLYASSKDYASASKDFAMVIKMGNRSAYMLNELAWSLFKTGRNSEALPYAEEAYKLASSDANVIDTRAHVYEALGRKQEAISDFRKAVALKPELEASRLGLRRLGAE